MNLYAYRGHSIPFLRTLLWYQSSWSKYWFIANSWQSWISTNLSLILHQALAIFTSRALLATQDFPMFFTSITPIGYGWDLFIAQHFQWGARFSHFFLNRYLFILFLVGLDHHRPMQIFIYFQFWKRILDRMGWLKMKMWSIWFGGWPTLVERSRRS